MNISYIIISHYYYSHYYYYKLNMTTTNCDCDCDSDFFNKSLSNYRNSKSYSYRATIQKNKRDVKLAAQVSSLPNQMRKCIESLVPSIKTKTSLKPRHKQDQAQEKHAQEKHAQEKKRRTVFKKSMEPEIFEDDANDNYNNDYKNDEEEKDYVSSRVITFENYTKCLILLGQAMAQSIEDEHEDYYEYIINRYEREDFETNPVFTMEEHEIMRTYYGEFPQNTSFQKYNLMLFIVNKNTLLEYDEDTNYSNPNFRLSLVYQIERYRKMY